MDELHQDILRSHILTRLDGPSLASAAATCSDLRRLSTDKALWADLCESTWPSTALPRVRDAISSLPGGHRWFFSEAHPTLAGGGEQGYDCGGGELISAVDLRYKGDPILSRVLVTETTSDWFHHSPFMLDLLHRKSAAVPFPGGGDTCQDLAEGLHLTWVVIHGGRAANLSSLRPVAVERHELTGDVHALFAAVVGRVRFGVSVTCGPRQVKEVRLTAEDVEGGHLSGRESMVIMGRAMRGNRGSGVGREEECFKRYLQFVDFKRLRKERLLRNEGVLDFVSAFFFTAVALFSLFWVTFGRR